jgi:hypothetical protein
LRYKVALPRGIKKLICCFLNHILESVGQYRQTQDWDLKIRREEKEFAYKKTKKTISWKISSKKG